MAASSRLLTAVGRSSATRATTHHDAGSVRRAPWHRRRGTVRKKRDEGASMEFGILFTSHPNHVTEPYPHRDVHARVTAEIEAADRLGYDTAWVAEHHFSNQYGIMPDVFTYMGYLAARTSRIKLGTAVVTVPLFEPVRYV